MTAIRILFDEAQIKKRVEELAQEIARSVPPDVMVVGLLTGSFVFVADLVRELGRIGYTPRVGFMRLSSYGRGRESSGEVKLKGDVPEVAGRHVLLVDDIVDTGRTQAFARELLLDQGAQSVRACVLMDKPSRREVAVATEFVGFSVGDLFLVGHGIDYAEQYRYLPYIGTID